MVSPWSLRSAKDEREAMRDLSMWPVTADPAEYDRRSIYLFVKRSFRLPMLDTFDAPDSAESCPRREASTVAPQALALMNSEWTYQQAVRFAAGIAKSQDPIGDAWQLALARAPDADGAQPSAANTYPQQPGTPLSFDVQYERVPVCQLSCRAVSCLLSGLGFPALAAAAVTNPQAAKAPHFPATAKSVIFLFMHGGPSHLETFDPKPALNKLDGQHVPASFGSVQLQFSKFEQSTVLGCRSDIQEVRPVGT